jgi:hypothetical protein
MKTATAYQTLRRIFTFALLAGFVGAGLAFSVGNATESLRGRAGAIIVLSAVAVMFIITPIGFLIAIKGVWEQRRQAERDIATVGRENPRLATGEVLDVSQGSNEGPVSARDATSAKPHRME